MNNSITKIILFIFLLWSCNSQPESYEYEHHQKYLQNTAGLSAEELENNNPIYLINLSSCSGCIDINFNYLIKNCHEINLEILIIGDPVGTIWQKQIDQIKNCYEVYIDRKSEIRRYNISSSKPLLIKFDDKGKVTNVQSVHENEIYKLPSYL